MRDAFVTSLHEIAAKDSRVMLLSSDIGFAVFDKFREDFPGRFINFGIAEANMIGAAAGLALSGMRPFAYTIIPFLTMRAFEQIRVDFCIQNQPAVLVGVGGGLAYGVLGPTHHALEDIAVMRCLPNMTVIVPADPNESRKATVAAYEHDGPVYIRLGKNGEPSLMDYKHFEIGRAVQITEGDDISLITSGPILRIALETSKLLQKSRISCRVINMHTIKPLDIPIILAAARETQAIIVLEEHSIIGGLGSAVAEVLAEAGVGKPFKRIGVQDKFCHTVGTQEHHWLEQGFSSENISSIATHMLDKLT